MRSIGYKGAFLTSTGKSAHTREWVGEAHGIYDNALTTTSHENVLYVASMHKTDP